MPGGEEGADEELDAEGWKLKFLELQVTYEELLESSQEYEQDLDNELKQYQILEKQLREEIVRSHHNASKHTADEHSRKELDSQRIRQLEGEIQSIKDAERRSRLAIRSLEQNNETLESSQRVLQAEVEEQGERLQEAIEELEFLRCQLEDYATGVISPVVAPRAGPPAAVPALELPKPDDRPPPPPRKLSSLPEATATPNEAKQPEIIDYEALYKEELSRSKAILMTLAAAQSELFSLRSVVSGLTFRDGATMAIERGMGAKIDSWTRVRQAKEAAAKEALERKGLEKASTRNAQGNGHQANGGPSGNNNTNPNGNANKNPNSTRGVLLTRNNKLTDVWNPRYYVIDENLHHLECYMMATRTGSHAGASSQRYGTVNLQGADIVSYADDLYGRPHCFGITPHFSKQTTQLQASSAQEKALWLSTLRALTTSSSPIVSLNTIKEGYLDVEVQGAWNRCFLTLSANAIKVFEKSMDRTPLAVLDLSDGGEVSDHKKLPSPSQTANEAGKKLTVIAESEELPLYATTTSSSSSPTTQFSFAVRNPFIQMVFRASSESERQLWVSSLGALLTPVGSGLQTTPRQAPKSSGPVSIGLCFVNTRLVVFLEVDLTVTVATLSEAVQQWMVHADQQKGRQNGPGSFLLDPPYVEQNACFYCRQEFTWRNRRHSCRNCGQSVCASCSMHTAVVFLGLGKAGEEPQRVCDSCHSILLMAQPAGDIGVGPSFEPRIELISISWHGEKLQEHLQLMDYGITLHSLLRVSFPEQAAHAGTSTIHHSRAPSSGRWKSLISSSSSHSRKGSEPSVASGLPVPHPSLCRTEKKGRVGQTDAVDLTWGDVTHRQRSATRPVAAPSPPPHPAHRAHSPSPPSSRAHSPSPPSSSRAHSPPPPRAYSPPPLHRTAPAPSSFVTSSSTSVTTSSTLPLLPSLSAPSPPPPPPPNSIAILPASSSALSLLDPLSPLLHPEDTDHTGTVEQLLPSTSSKLDWKPRTLVLSHASKCLFYQSPALLKREATLKRTSRINPRLEEPRKGSPKLPPRALENLESQTLGQIPLASITLVTVNNFHGKDHVFTVYANSRTWVYAAPSAQAQKDWVAALQAYCKP